MIDTAWSCFVAGPVIAGLVQLFKGWSLVAKYPKVWALVLSGVMAAVSGFTFGSFEWAAIAECVIVPFMGAIATYEVGKATVEVAWEAM